MSSTTFILLGVTYYIFSIIIIVLVLNKINGNSKKKYQETINNLERDKNLIISAGILTELNKVEHLVNNDLMQEMYDDLKTRFDEIKKLEIPKITDEIIEIQDLFEDKDYKKLEELLNQTELDIYFLKSKSNYLLNEIKEITLSENKNRENATKLKTKYREIITKYNNNKNSYNIINKPIELQFENVDKLFSAFEVNMEQNNYQEVNKIIKALDDIIGNLGLVIEEAPSIILMGTKLIPKKIEDIYNTALKLEKEGYNLDYLNINYNISEAQKKVKEIEERLNVLNLTDSTLELKTILDYFEGLYNEFDKEKIAYKLFDEYMRKVLVKANKLEKINNDLRRKTSDFKYSYDMTDDDLVILDELKEQIKSIKKDYDKLVAAYHNKQTAFTRLTKGMEELSSRLSLVEERLQYALENLGTLKDDELRAREQLEEIKDILRKAKDKINSYNLPIIPKEYYVHLKEATDSIKEVNKELEKQPISIKTLNIRVDTARDLVLKLYTTSKELVKSAYMAEMSIVYGNRYRSINKNVDALLTRAEIFFEKGEFKKSLENSVEANNLVEPNFYETLKNTYENK